MKRLVALNTPLPYKGLLPEHQGNSWTMVTPTGGTFISIKLLKRKISTS